MANDKTAIEFPTDRITLKMVREREPWLVATSTASGGVGQQCDAIEAMALEQQLVENAVAQAGRGAAPNTSESRDALVMELDSHYRIYGLSNGEAQTQELVRRIERQAIRVRGSAVR